MNILIEFVGEELIYTLGWTFFHSIWQASLIALFLVLFLQNTPVKSANNRYQASMFALFAVLISSLCTFIYYYGSVTGSTVPDLSPFAPAVEPSAMGGTMDAGVINSWDQVLAAYHPFLVAFWVSGMLIFAIKMAGGLFYIHYLRRSSRPLTMPAHHTLYQLQRKLGFRKFVGIATSSFARVPMVIGHLKPVILFPVGAINQLTPGELEAILAHELAHIRRYDYIQNLIQSVIEIIFYYHPAVWWISSVIRSERENTCDDLAVKLCGNKMTYAKALVRLETIHQFTPALAMPLFRSKNQLFIRIKRILNQPYHKSNTMEKLFATLLCIGCFLLLSMSNENTFGEDPAKAYEPVPVQSNMTEVIEIRNNSLIKDHISVLSDTIPGKSKVKTRISKFTDEEQIEITMQNGEITELIIDGRTIPSNEYEQYMSKVESLMAESERVPPMPPPPPPPPALNDLPEPPAPPEAPEPADPDNVMPAPPPPPPHWMDEDEQVIIHKLEEDGKRIIKVEKRGPGMDNEMEIIVDGEVIILDGEQFSTDTIIVGKDHRFRVFGDSMEFKFMPHPDFDFDFDFDDDAFRFEFDSNRIGFFKGEGFENLYHWMPDSNWSKELHLEMEELREHLREQKEELGEHYFENLEEWERQHELSEEQLKDFREQQEEQRIRLKRDFKQQREDQRMLREEMMRLRKREMEEQARGRAQAFKERERLRAERFRRNPGSDHRIFRGGSAENALIHELTRDGLINPEEGYTIKMDNRKLKINGEKMPDVLYEKYRKVLQRYHGDEASEVDIQIRKEVKKKF